MWADDAWLIQELAFLQDEVADLEDQLAKPSKVFILFNQDVIAGVFATEELAEAAIDINVAASRSGERWHYDITEHCIFRE